MILNGKKIAAALCQDLALGIQKIQGRKPCLAFILVGDDSASQTYVRAKKKACSATGIVSSLLELPASVAQDELLAEIEKRNQDPAIDGILVQLPLPSHISESAVLCAIDPSKDVDGFHPLNVGKMLLGEESGFFPCTPQGILVLLEKSGISVAGKRTVIVGRSNIVGKPLAALLMQKKSRGNATVTVAHSQSEHLKEICQSGEILIAAVGKRHFITKDMVQPGAVVIDVGIHRLPDKTLTGDVDFAQIAPIASAITPVPGGVGPMTIAMLLQNTLKAFQNRFPLA